MGFFSFNQEIAIDLGTANTIILYNDKIVVDAPSMVALDNRTGKLKAVGHEAQAMYGRAPENIRVIRPLQNGVIADFNAAEQMMRGMMKMVSMRNTLFSSSLLSLLQSFPSVSCKDLSLKTNREVFLNPLQSKTLLPCKMEPSAELEVQPLSSQAPDIKFQVPSTHIGSDFFSYFSSPFH